MSIITMVTQENLVDYYVDKTIHNISAQGWSLTRPTNV